MLSRRLDTLPAELLAEVAGNLNVYEVLCFTATCHNIRRACLDPLLFKALIEHQHTTFDFHSLNLERIIRRMHQDANVLARYSGSEPRPDSRQVYLWEKAFVAETVQQHFGLDQQVWFRYAVADYLAFQLCDQLEHLGHFKSRSPSKKSQVRLNLEHCMQYLPHLLMLKHPSIHSLGLAPTFMTQIILATKPPRVNSFDAKPGLHLPEINSRTAFSFCATMLSQDTPSSCLLDTADPLSALTKFFIQRVCDTALKLRVTRDLGADLTTQTLSQADAQILVGVFSAILRRAFREYRVRRLIGADYYTFVLPFVHDIPLLGDDESALPVPFPDSFDSLRRRPGDDQVPTLAWEDWQDKHIARLSSPEALSHGRWAGCYAEVHKPPRAAAPEIDAPMRDVQLRVHGDRSIEGEGWDAVGAFTLRGDKGCVDASGALVLRMTYRHAPHAAVVWHARITPFGIAGLCRTPAPAGHEPEFGGCFWLWRMRWTGGQAA